MQQPLCNTLSAKSTNKLLLLLLPLLSFIYMTNVTWSNKRKVKIKKGEHCSKECNFTPNDFIVISIRK